MSDEPQKVNVNVQGDMPSRLWDPNGPRSPWWLSAITNTTGLGLICLLFAWNFVRQGEQAERVIEKMQAGLDKQDNRSSKERDREISRQEKQHEAALTQMRDWNKAISERQSLEADKVRLELKGMTEQMKLLTDRVRMQTMKD